jgi:hypothetical protein
MVTHDESRLAMAATYPGTLLARVTGGIFVVGAVAFAGAASVLSSTFGWPDILREPAAVVLPAVVAGGTGLVWTWFATGWTYALLVVPILLLPAVLGRRDDPVLRAATAVGATSVLLSLIGFLRWVFVVPPLARSYVTGDPITQAAVDAAWTAQHQFGGALLGEHLGQLLAIGWSLTLSVIILRSRVLPRWLGVAGWPVPRSPAALTPGRGTGRRRGHRSRHRRRPGCGQLSAARPAPMDAGHRDRHESGTPPRSHRLLPPGAEPDPDRAPAVSTAVPRA